MTEANYLQQSRKKPVWSYVFFVLGVLLLIFILSATLFGLIFLQSVDENLDIRRQALVTSKRVDFNTFPFSQSFFKVQEPSRIELQINTYNHTIDALELGLYIETDAGLWNEADLQITEARESQLKLVQTEIQQSDCDPQHDCYLVTLLLISSQPTVPFTTRNLSTSIANFEFTPLTEGAFSLQLAQTSQVNEHGTGLNILQNIASAEFNYYVSNNGIDFAQCRYLYGDWSDCDNFWQTRQYQVLPSNCHWHQQETLEDLSRQCQAVTIDNQTLAKNEDFFLHYFASCLSSISQGDGFYLLWNTEQYPDFDWLDVSLDHHFNNFYQKATRSAQQIGQYAIIDLTNFSGFSQAVGGQTLSFRPDQKYYFRLYNDYRKEFVYGPQLSLDFCSAELSQRLNCQEPCIETERGSNCFDGLTCIGGSCRLATNPQNQWCFDPELLGEVASVEDVIGVEEFGSVAGASTQISDSHFVIQGPFLPSEVYDITTYACNHGCNTNRDCMPNYRCYQGRCRLASNPESADCEGAEVIHDPELIEQKGIGPDYELLIEEPNPSSPPPTSTVIPEPEVLESTHAASVEDTASVTDTTQVDQQPEVELDSEPDSEAAALGNLSTIFSNFSATMDNFFKNFNWQYLALAGLFIIIAIVFIVLGLSHNPRQKKSKSSKRKAKKS